jgi:cytochrome bd-type quinol oxidase subunit 2
MINIFHFRAYLALFIVTLIVALLLTTGLASAQSAIWDGLFRGAELTDPDASPVNAEDQINAIISTIINLFSLVVGVISVIMIIIGGLKYITSGGDSGNVTSAKNTILYAIIGLVIVALAQVIVRFVIERITGV